jgi:hypothetical protein
MVLWHEPVGKLEHAFDFSADSPEDKRPPGDRLSIATAVNFVDTLAARCTLRNRGVMARSVASYVEAGAFARLGYTMAGMLAPVLAAPLVDGLARAQFELLPTTLGAFDLRASQAIALEIEGPLRQPWVDWVWITPNAYGFTARIAVEVACRLASRRAGPAPGDAPPGPAIDLIGWRTPEDVLDLGTRDLEHGPFRGCRLIRRHRALEHGVRVQA